MTTFIVFIVGFVVIALLALLAPQTAFFGNMIAVLVIVYVILMTIAALKH